MGEKPTGNLAGADSTYGPSAISAEMNYKAPGCPINTAAA
jgi:hypothetical protein